VAEIDFRTKGQKHESHVINQKPKMAVNSDSEDLSDDEALKIAKYAVYGGN